MVSFPTRFKREPRGSSPASSERTLCASESSAACTTSVGTTCDNTFSRPGTVSTADTSERDWELVGGDDESNNRPGLSDVRLEIHPLQDQKGVLVSVKPPNEPEEVAESSRCPMDIVLVVDVSLSMNTHAHIPGDTEPVAFTIMDLVKNAADGVVESLGERDRFGMVTFGYDAVVSTNPLGKMEIGLPLCCGWVPDPPRAFRHDGASEDGCQGKNQGDQAVRRNKLVGRPRDGLQVVFVRAESPGSRSPEQWHRSHVPPNGWLTEHCVSSPRLCTCVAPPCLQ